MEDRERTLDSPTDKILLAVSGFADEVERDKARQRTYDAMRRKAGAGHVTGGVVFGYENVPVLTADGKRDHVARRILESEATVVRRIFALSAEGSAHGASPIPSMPRAPPRLGLVAAVARKRGARRRSTPCSPVRSTGARSSGTRPRNGTHGASRRRPRAEADWLRVPAPELRIVPEPLWLAVERRLASMRTFYLRSTDGKLHGRARGANGHESQYLLTGLAACGACTGGLTVHSRAWGTGRQQTYVCGHYHRKGTTVCTNRRVLPMVATNAEVLRSIEITCLSPAAVERIVEGALETLTRPPEAAEARETTLRGELAALETEIARYAAAVGQAPDLASVLEALRTGNASGPRFEPNSRGFGDSVRRGRLTAARWSAACVPWSPTGAG